jgi:uncharacterized membrane protein
MKENKDYKNEALAALKGHWPQAVLAFLVLEAIALVICIPYIRVSILAETGGDVSGLMKSIGVAMLVLFLGAYLFLGPLTVGMVNAYKRLHDGDGAVTANMFRIGLGNWWHHVAGFFLKYLFIGLWSLLLWIPGIIKAFSYAMTEYILVDYPDLSANKAIDLSRAMMKDRKFDLFYLYLSFIGWVLLGILTLGIGLLWVYPYIEAAQAAFYQDVKADYFRRREMGNAEAAPAPAAPAPAEEAPQPVRREENPEDYMPK